MSGWWRHCGGRNKGPGSWSWQFEAAFGPPFLLGGINVVTGCGAAGRILGGGGGPDAGWGVEFVRIVGDSVGLRDCVYWFGSWVEAFVRRQAPDATCFRLRGIAIRGLGGVWLRTLA